MTISRSSISKISSSLVKSLSDNATEKHEKPNVSSPVSPSPDYQPKQSPNLVPQENSSLSPSISPSHLCADCGREGVQLTKITRSFGRGSKLLIIEDIPMWLCPHCGASYFTAQTMHEIERIKMLRKAVAVDRPVPVAIFIGQAA